MEKNVYVLFHFRFLLDDLLPHLFSHLSFLQRDTDIVFTDGEESRGREQVSELC